MEARFQKKKSGTLILPSLLEDLVVAGATLLRRPQHLADPAGSHGDDSQVPLRCGALTCWLNPPKNDTWASRFFHLLIICFFCPPLVGVKGNLSLLDIFSHFFQGSSPNGRLWVYSLLV